MLENQYFIHFAVLVILGAFVHGFTGLGFGILVVAGLAFTPMDLERASAVLTLLLPVLFGVLLLANRKAFGHSIRWKLAGVLFIGTLSGVPLGYWFLYTCGARPVFYLTLGLVLVLFSVDYLVRPRIRSRLPLPFGLVAALSGGFLAGAFTAGGPPMALFLYTHFDNPHEAKGTLQLVFLSATGWRLINIVLFSEGFTRHIITWAAMLVPLVVLFALVGNLAGRRLSPTAFSRVVYSFIGLAGLMNIIRYFR